MTDTTSWLAPSTKDFATAQERLANIVKLDRQVADLTPDRSIAQSLKRPGLSLVALVDIALRGYDGRPALGSRAYEIRKGADGRCRRHYLPAFETITYGMLRRRIEAVASTWRHHPQLRVAAGELVCLIGFTSAELVTMDTSCAYAQLVAVPVQANLPPADVRGILRDTEPAAMISTVSNLELAVGYVLDQPSIRSLIVIDIDTDDEDERERLESARNRLHQAGSHAVLTTFHDVVAFGENYEWAPFSPREEGSDAMTVVMYTSGTTGTPKGAIIQEENCREAWRASPGIPTVQLAYAPLNHLMGRNVVFITLADGGTVYFTLKSDMSTLFEDLRIVRPTFIVFMPRVAEIIYQQYLSSLQRRVAAGEEFTVADAIVRAAMASTTLGDRIVAGAVGGAPTAPEVQRFLRDCFQISLSESYGCTEAGASPVVTDGRVQRGSVLDYKLIDVPELGYYTTDKPMPRGELLVKSRLMIPGYFKRPQTTAEVFDEEGWLHTGDIMVEQGPDRLTWLDRRNNVIKLNQGEYVAVGPLESCFTADSKLIHQIYVYGSSYRAYLLAVVVPDMEVARARVGREPTREDLQRVVLADLQETASAANLKTFEVPRNVHIELEPFTHENGLLSSVRKPLRPKLKERYQGVLEAMYQEMHSQQEAELARLRAGNNDMATVDRVIGAFKAALGRESIDPRGTQSYGESGGDSLGAVSLSVLLEEMFGVAVPVSVLLGPMSSPARLAILIDNARHAGEARGTVSFAAVHGSHPATVHAGDFGLDSVLGAAIFDKAGRAAPPVAETSRVLVTGATGFLGRFLLLEWLEHANHVGGRVFALVRASDARQGRARLAEAYGVFDRELAERFHALADSHLEVITGDLASPGLGIDEAQFTRLTAEVDHIVHPGALVNHRLSYQNLFEPNVVGTAELIRLALMHHQKRFDFVSTSGVALLAAKLLQEPETADVRAVLPEVALAETYAAGYSVSKWAGEVLLREAHEHFGLPVTVYRPDMITPHPRYRGHINVPDMLTRLLFSIVISGVAPWSFYERAQDGGRARVHYDATPVDFLAVVLRQLSSRPFTGYRTFNTVSSHLDDGVSLDTLVDWVQSAGFAVERLADYGEWLRRFEQKLRNLSAEQREHSSINLLDHFARPQQANAMKPRNGAFVEAVRDLPVAAEVPRLSEAYIHKYLDDMQLLGLLPSPPVKK